MRERTGYGEILRANVVFVTNLIRRTYMYTQTTNVRTIVAKKGPKIAVWAMLSSQRLNLNGSTSWTNRWCLANNYTATRDFFRVH